MLIALLLLVSVLLKRNISYKWRYAISLSSFAWGISSFVLLIFKLATIISGSVAQVLSNWNMVSSFIVQVRTGQMLALQIFIAFLISILSQFINSRKGFLVLLILGILNLLPPSLNGHSGSRNFHEVAILSWAVHIVSISIWVALVCGLSYLFLFKEPTRFDQTKLVSKISLFCFVGTVLSGFTNAATRVNNIRTLAGSEYGRLLILKIVIVSVVGVIATVYRFWMFQNLQQLETIFRRTLGIEIFLLSLAVMLGVLLSTTSLPVVRIVPN